MSIHYCTCVYDKSNNVISVCYYHWMSYRQNSWLKWIESEKKE